MKTVVKVPKLGDSAENIYIVEWKVAVGDKISEGDTLLIADTNKVAVSYTHLTLPTIYSV